MLMSTRSSDASREAESDGHIVIYGTMEPRIGDNVAHDEEGGDDGARDILEEEVRPLVPEQRETAVQSLEVGERHDVGEREQGVSESEMAQGSSVFDGAKSAWQQFKLTFFKSSTDNDDSPEQGDIEQGCSTSSHREADASPGAVCLICLDPLLPEDFQSGKAMSLECGCRGDLALRHRDCAIKWSQVKDDGRGGLPVCELCKKPVQNLPELPARPREEHDEEDIGITIEEAYFNDPSQFQQFAPSRADIVFDCIRVTWIAMIISILFFNANIEVALWTGLVAGAAYIVMLRLLYKQHFEAMRAYAEQHAAAVGQRVHQVEVQTV